MNRITYQYQLLRFMPDRVTGEFAHVGVVMYVPNQRILRAYTIKKYGRLSQFFGSIPGHYLLHTLEQIQKSMDLRSERLKHELQLMPVNDLGQFTNEVFQQDDSALFFSDVFTGIGLSPEKSFDTLVEKFLPSEAEEEHRVTDKEIWTKVFKKYFEAKGIANKLHEKTVVTPTDTLKFDLAYINGHLNCLEPTNFDLKTEETIREKVNRIIGKWDALAQSNQTIDYHILANTPALFPEMQRYIQMRLSNRTNGNATIHLVTANTVEHFIEKVEQDLEHAT
jgi:hypothetical protein